MVHRHIHAIHAAQDGAALVFQFCGKILDLFGCRTEQLVELRTERRIVRRDRRQHSGMEERIFERLLELPYRLNNARLQQRVQVAKTQHLFLERIEAAENLNMIFRKRRQVGVGENFDQSDFEW